MDKLCEFFVLLEKEDRNWESINIYWKPSWNQDSERKLF